jgi:hypothetical protein
MANKITLVTPPDFYENSNFSILFIGMTEKDQDDASAWLGQNERYPDCNFYYFQGENNMEWLLYALHRSDAVFLNFNVDRAIINIMGSYILSRPNVYYTTEDDNMKALMSYVNNQYLPNITDFLEKVFNDQRT